MLSREKFTKKEGRLSRREIFFRSIVQRCYCKIRRKEGKKVCGKYSPDGKGNFGGGT